MKTKRTKIIPATPAKEEVVVTPAQPEQVVEYVVFVCDVCGEERKQLRTCRVCKRGVCAKCRTYDPNHHCYNPGVWCEVCNHLWLAKYRKKSSHIEDARAKAKEVLRQEWVKESLSAEDEKEE